MKNFICHIFIIDLHERNYLLSLLQRNLKYGPINNAENHNENQGAEKSENFQMHIRPQKFVDPIV